MSGDFVLLGDSITDRSNRVTLVRPVAQRLGIDWKGYVEFYLLNGNIVLRKGEKDYDPNNGRTGFYMGSSVVDKEKRATLIRLVVQNLQLDDRSTVDFFLFENEIVIKETVFMFQPFIEEVDINTLSDENRELAHKGSRYLAEETMAFLEAKKAYPSNTGFQEILAKVQEKVLKDISPRDRKLLLTVITQSFHKTIAPDDIEGITDKTIASMLFMNGCPREKLKEQVELMKRTSHFIDEFGSGARRLSDKKKRELLDKHGLERSEDGRSIRLKKMRPSERYPE